MDIEEQSFTILLSIDNENIHGNSPVYQAVSIFNGSDQNEDRPSPTPGLTSSDFVDQVTYIFLSLY